jgi:hypothetical protein
VGYISYLRQNAIILSFPENKQHREREGGREREVGREREREREQETSL